MIKFEDLPSTNTPLNAANLNTNFDELKNNVNELNNKIKVDVLLNQKIESDGVTKPALANYKDYDFVYVEVSWNSAYSGRIHGALLSTTSLQSANGLCALPSGRTNVEYMDISIKENQVQSISGFTAYFTLNKILAIKLI